MKIYDFDEKFFEYAQTWMALHPGLTEKQVEAKYNEIMSSWLNAPAKWLDGEKPISYFDRYSESKDLMKLIEEYDKRGLSLPEPLYTRVVTLGETCVDALNKLALNRDRGEALRSTAVALLRDIDSPKSILTYIELVTTAREQNEPAEMSAEALYNAPEEVTEDLLGKYEAASAYAQELILDICANFPGNARTFDFVVEKLRTEHDKRAYFASLLAKLADPRGADVLMPFLTLSDLGYLDYIEIRNAIETLGGDPGEERTFYGDPDYEAMKNFKE